ncbi:HD-GYP domain-containing protein [Pseudovibrio ascidiaceicola]|uniref:HD-GYP domain-containing protein n=1 Tax=Pseudovibrio ascidiaceicola TaxID=285279 RepID=UPI003D360675
MKMAAQKRLDVLCKAMPTEWCLAERLDYLRRYLKSQHEETFHHSNRTADLAFHFTHYLPEFNQHRREELVMAMRCHDLGKLVINRSILDANRRLTDQEMVQTREHTTASFVLVGPHASDMVKNVAKYHHEAYNGMGYFGLKGEDIPFEARIAAVCDVFDALSSERTYKRGMTAGQALSIMTADKEDSRAMGRRTFDPYLMRAFSRYIVACREKEFTVQERESLDAYIQSQPMEDFKHDLSLNRGWSVHESGQRTLHDDKGVVKLLSRGGSVVYDRSKRDYEPSSKGSGLER